MPEYCQAVENFSPEQAKNAQVIKTSPGRSVFFVTIDDISCVLKIFYAPTFWDRIRVRFLSSRACLEWKYLHLLRSKKLPVAEPVAMGRRGTTSYLIVKKIPEAKTLKQLIFKPPSPLSHLQKQDLWNAVARLLAQMHNEKIVHRDLHFSNIVQDRRGNVYLLDLHDVCTHRFMGAGTCLKNLAMFGSSFTMCITSCDYLRFLRGYRAHSDFLGKIPRVKCVNWAKKCLADYQLAFWRKRAKRCLKDNKYFRKIDLKHGNGFCGGQENTACRELENLECTLSQASFIKSSRTTVVAKTPGGILKKYRRKKKRNLLIDCFRSSRAKRAWLSGYHCMIRGIPTAKPLGYLEKRKARFLVSNCIITEEIVGAQTAQEYLQSFGPKPSGEAFLRKREFLRQLGRSVRTMHLRALSHRDLKLNNLLVDRHFRLYIVDMDGLRDIAPMGRRRRVKDLHRLFRALKTVPQLTRADKWRVLSSYLPYTKKHETLRWRKNLNL